MLKMKFYEVKAKWDKMPSVVRACIWVVLGLIAGVVI